MKRIIFVNNNMHLGGVQKSLVNLLWSIRGRYDITLLLFFAGGEYMKELPPEVKVITPRSFYRYLGMTRKDTKTVGDRLGRSLFAATARILGRKVAVKWMALGQKRLEGYDIAVSCLHNAGSRLFYGGCNEFVLNHVSAGKKVAFLHCDYLQSGANTPENGEIYKRFDEIAACSQGCMESFLAAHPALREKTCVVPNCQHFEQILRGAERDPLVLPMGRINLLTVARLGKEKGVIRAVEALGRLGERQEGIHYYVVGEGNQRPCIEEKIRQLHLEERVTLLGEKVNPYGYMKAADVLLIPSLSEAAPMVIGEAASLGTPIFSTETSSAREMVETSGYGWVCENSVDGMAEGLRHLLENPSEIEKKACFLRSVTFNNDYAVAQFVALAER